MLFTGCPAFSVRNLKRLWFSSSIFFTSGRLSRFFSSTSALGQDDSTSISCEGKSSQVRDDGLRFSTKVKHSIMQCNIKFYIHTHTTAVQILSHLYLETHNTRTHIFQDTKTLLKKEKNATYHIPLHKHHTSPNPHSHHHNPTLPSLFIYTM